MYFCGRMEHHKYLLVFAYVVLLHIPFYTFASTFQIRCFHKSNLTSDLRRSVEDCILIFFGQDYVIHPDLILNSLAHE
ncbi:hypothetical protein L2E82_01115 [Cichorium intybus]|uniref:Uncharacterized protein n=1 Tax=Cichorium intybus TaxID=13427 RepID=A0ACB9GYT8_CICIN|nr:hypothetical protein L2E82_01115 [Cichorium intybus]